LLHLAELDFADPDSAAIVDVQGSGAGGDLDAAMKLFGLPPIPVGALDGDRIAVLLAVRPKV